MNFHRMGAVAALAAMLATSAANVGRAQEQAPGTLAVDGKPTAQAQEIEFWQSVKDTKSPDEIKAYLEKYPNGEFAALAKVRLQSLGRPTAPPTPLPPATPAGVFAMPLPYVPLPSPLAEMTPEVIMEVQKKLYEIGFDVPKPDGKMSDKLKAAIARLQANSRMPDTGRLTAAQLTALRLTPAPAPWAAIAWQGRGGSAGAWNSKSRVDAETAALAACKKQGQGCNVAAAPKDSCIAYAYSQARIGNTIHHANAMGIGVGFVEAREKAILSCHGLSKAPSTCAVKQTVCPDGSHQTAEAETAQAAARQGAKKRPEANPASKPKVAFPSSAR
jgi:peptidoglycan hydrolase-like protein with peptidoglycan-binding domain